MHAHKDIRIGTLVPAHDRTPKVIGQLQPYGFETFQVSFETSVGDVDLAGLAARIARVLESHPAPPSEPPPRVSAIGVYGNPRTSHETVHDSERLIDAAALFGCDVVSGFAGRGVRLAFENCENRGTWEAGDWHIAHAQRAWDAMFEAVDSPAIGLEREPCHQVVSFVDPLPQLRRYAHRIWRIHGQDATVLWDVVRTPGIRGGVQYIHHRTPGFGDTNWTDLISILRMCGWRGGIDIEGFHDPAYRNVLETTGQVAAIDQLKRCRGGRFVPNVF